MSTQPQTSNETILRQARIVTEDLVDNTCLLFTAVTISFYELKAGLDKCPQALQARCEALLKLVEEAYQRMATVKELVNRAVDLQNEAIDGNVPPLPPDSESFGGTTGGVSIPIPVTRPPTPEMPLLQDATPPPNTPAEEDAVDQDAETARIQNILDIVNSTTPAEH